MVSIMRDINHNYTTTTTGGATAAARAVHESVASTGLGAAEAVTVAVENKDEVETDEAQADPKGAAEARRRRWVLPAKVISSPAEVLAGEVQAHPRATSTREAAEETVRGSTRCRRAVSAGEQAVGSIMGRRSGGVEAVFRISRALSLIHI